MDEPATIDAIAPDTYRIHVPVPAADGAQAFSFNQYLIVDERPLLFHTGPRRLYPLVSARIASVMPLERLRYIAFSHVEADECGSLAEFLRAAPGARPVCSRVAAMVSVGDMVDVESIAMEDGQLLDLGRHRLKWQSTPHLPHAWECGYLFDETTGTLFCGDLFTQPGIGREPLVTTDILGPSEEFRRRDDYYSHTTQVGPLIDKLAALRPAILACMHGSAWAGDGAQLLRRLGAALAAS